MIEFWCQKVKGEGHHDLIASHYQECIKRISSNLVQMLTMSQRWTDLNLVMMIQRSSLL